MRNVLFILSIVIFTMACNGPDKPVTGGPDAVKHINYSVIRVLPHDTSSFTEGLLFYKGELYESTGNKHKSKLLKVDLNTGKAIKSLNLDTANFGEGIVIINDTIYQLTYQEKVGFMYSVKDFKKLGEFKFASQEGWGMTTNGKEIIASDGTSTLHYYEPGTFRLLRTQSVMEAGSLSFNINELEYIDGYIYANQWQYPYILKIDPNSGEVVAKIDLSTITEKVKATYPQAELLNGIAYNPETKKIYITGKWWPEMYEIALSN